MDSKQLNEQFLCYDPRDDTQSLDDTSTWKPTRNPALILANQYGYLPADIDWGAVAKFADYAEAPPLRVLKT